MRIKKMHKYNIIVVWVSICMSLWDYGCDSYSKDSLPILYSPNQKLKTVLRKVDSSRLEYALISESDTILGWSSLGLQIEDDADLNDHWEIQSTEFRSVDERVATPLGERDSVVNHFNELLLKMVQGDKMNRQFSITLRLFNEGLAFRYTITEGAGWKDTIRISDEYTTFSLGEDWSAYYEEGHEGEYQKLSIGQFPGRCELPLLMESNKGYVIINEGALENYSRLALLSDKSTSNVLHTTLFASVKVRAPFSTPWRIVRYAPSLKSVVEENYLTHVLAPPNKIEEVSWIQPGKAMRVMTNILNTEGAISVADFASNNGLEYIELDAGWYGKGYGMQNEGDPESDPRSVIEGLDLPYITDHAHKQGLKVIVYVNKVGLEGHSEEIFPLYKKWGIDGLKFGFVDGRTQQGINDTHKWVEMAADYKFIVDIHDNYRPTGMSRTYPNLLTQEGIRGNEHGPTTRHNTTLPFTRFITGAGDYTFCYLHPRAQGTSAHQLALGVVYFSPLQFVYWYGIPQDYTEAIGTTFFEQLPTIWNESHFVKGEIGEYVVMARRNKDNWYIGAITNEQRREIEIDFAMLDIGKNYDAILYEDTATEYVDTTKKSLDHTSSIVCKLEPNGGVAMVLTPQ